MALFDHETFARRFANAMSDQDQNAVAQLMTEDFVTEWPQTGERVRGPANFWAIIENYPDRIRGGDDLTTLVTRPGAAMKLVAPAYTFVAVEGAGITGTFTLKVKYPDGSDWWVITLYRLRGDRLAYCTTFFAPVLPSPEWRAQWVERM
jgi:hypothetical protein